MGDDVISELVKDLRVNTKNRSDLSIKNFMYFLKCFQDRFNITLQALYNKETKIKTITDQDIFFFIEHRSKAYIFFLSYIAKRYLDIDLDPIKSIKKYRAHLDIISGNYLSYPVKEKKGTPYLKNEELEKLYDELDSYDKIGFLILITTGMRRGALIKCDRSKIDYSYKVPIISTIEKGNVLTKYTLNPEIIHLLKENPTFNFYTAATLRTLINRCKKILNKHIKTHIFRFTFARLVLNTKNNAQNVQVLLDHANLSTTQTSYIKETYQDKSQRLNLPWQLRDEKQFALPKFLTREHILLFCK
ncbi:unknown [Diachasmimorpha longicaudata entomopoxvirus]|uniref:Tyr recombinase domain-containing protein n=1 Tax=Diachasmimorpha longicaudata entomopoxvirus TaxID=109981 RepID=Q5GF28_9POXV|nr:hypothetical protein FLA14_p601 [Diachasmimorpha longicaudata entomopoxvirus]AAT99856.1 unknown [Diachasmimorpha longicaudata entomopoxvirus]